MLRLLLPDLALYFPHKDAYIVLTLHASAY